jgi:hypothetical protein
MKHVIEAGTDAATLTLFDPEALPEDADRRLADDPIELLERLHAEGRVYWINTHADGSYILHVYVGEPVPDTLQPYTRDPVVVESFQVPTGRLYFIGAEYTGSEEFVRRHIRMGGDFELRPGVYRLTVSETEYPEGLHEDLLRHEVSPGAYTLLQSMGCFVWLAILSVIGLLVVIFNEFFRLWRYYLMPPFAFAIVWPFVLARMRAYRETLRRYREIQQEHPAYVAHLEWRGEC